MKALEDAGVKPIEAVGKEFDPNFHNAVMHAEDENFGENIVAEESIATRKSVPICLLIEEIVLSEFVTA